MNLIERISELKNRKESEEKLNKIWYIIIFLIVIISVILIWIFFLKKPKINCGNGICEGIETYSSCCLDCGCPTGYECENNQCITETTTIEQKTTTTITVRVTTTTFGSLICGNGICEDKEDCYDCPQDCKCNQGEYCSPSEKNCIKPICGNGNCEPFESSENCCDDCGCSPNEKCDVNRHICIVSEANISDELVKSLIIEYYKDKGKTVESIDIVGSTFVNNIPAKSASVKIEGIEFKRIVSVTENREVIELPIL